VSTTVPRIEAVMLVCAAANEALMHKSPIVRAFEKPSRADVGRTVVFTLRMMRCQSRGRGATRCRSNERSL
jgi:hypothetical protein